MAKPAVYMMIGAPASGKTVYAEMIAETCKAAIVEVLRIRAANPAWTSSRVFQEAKDITQAHLTMGVNVILDATNTNSKHRAQMVFNLEGHTDRFYGIWMDTPLAECLARHAARTRNGILRPINDKLIAGMHGSLVRYPISADEGFSRIIRVTPSLAEDIHPDLLPCLS